MGMSKPRGEFVIGHAEPTLFPTVRSFCVSQKDTMTKILAIQNDEAQDT
jgi:hypothetical protein